MATFAQDTAANQAVVQAAVDDMRSYLIGLRALNQKYASLLADWFNGNPGGSAASVLVTAYDGGSIIPRSATLGLDPSATQVTREAVLNAFSYLQDTQALNDAAHLNVMVPFAGVNNL